MTFEVETTPDDVADADTPLDVPAEEITPVTFSAVLLTPADGQVFEAGAPVLFEATVSHSAFAPEELTARWISDTDGPLAVGPVEADGGIDHTVSNLSPGMHGITLEVEDPDGLKAWAMVTVSICTWSAPETFDADVTGASWKVYGDAYWDEGGWLEMTGDLIDREGAIYNVVDRVAPGDVSISFRILTGPNVEFGADGFAMSVFNVETEAALDAVVGMADGGGGLMYGVAGEYAGWIGEAFHVEFDTWHNIYNGDTELHSDPTPQSHVAVCLNGDPGEHHLWAAIPSIEDMAWHDVTIEVEGDTVRVTLDGVEVLNGAITGLDFRGGYIGFSGSTGYYHNYHRFDELQILDECVVP